MTVDRLSTTVRSARPGDAEFIADLIGGMGYDVRTDDVRLRLRDLPEHHAVFVAETRDRVVGWVHVVASHSLIVAQHAEIAGLAVAADIRGTGVGTTLMRTAERWARERGLGGVRLRSRDDRAPAHHFYRSLGYAEVKKQVAFAKQLAAPPVTW